MFRLAARPGSAYKAADQSPTLMKTSLTVLVVLGLALNLTFTPLRAADPPKPGPEQKKLEMLVGEWTYEGTGEATPFMDAAGKFKGKYTARLVLGGFFVQGQGQDISDNQYLYQDMWFTGYDTAKKTFINHSFENDGTIAVNTLTVSGNTWITQGTRTDSKGKVYRTKTVETFAADGKSSASLTEYSTDDGKTWHKAWASKATKVGP